MEYLDSLWFNLKFNGFYGNTIIPSRINYPMEVIPCKLSEK